MKIISDPCIMIICSNYHECHSSFNIDLRHSKFSLWSKPSSKKISEHIELRGWLEDDNSIICKTCQSEEVKS